MSFTVNLGKNISDSRKFAKAVTTLSSLSGVLKNETSIVNPTIIFEADLSSFTNCNYMSIPSFGRSYFVTDIKSVSNSLIEVTGHCDVLSSFSSQIKANSAIIARQENYYNLYLDDGLFKVYQNPYVITQSFPSGLTSRSLVLIVAGAAG